MTTFPQIHINRKAALWTTGVHIALLLLFILVRLSLPPQVTPPPELGMEVNLGTSETGSGADQPLDSDDPAPQANPRQRAAAAAATESYTTESNHPDDEAVRRPQQLRQNGRQQSTQPARRTEPQRTPRYVMQGSTGRGGNSAASDQDGSNEGISGGPGDQGVPGGTAGSSNYTGSPGSGQGGISHTLNGRSISPSRFEAEFREGGKVVVRVTVDRQGRITDHTVLSTPNAELRRIALEKLRQSRFSPNPNAAPETFGTITIVFKARS
jgi:TonB family protein